MMMIINSAAFKHFMIGAISGVATAARTDYAAFVGMKSFQDALSYNWNIALWRWFQGAVIGGVSTGVLGNFSG